MKSLVLSVVLVLSFSAFGFASPSWTIMVFMNADNNLEGAAIADFVEMVLAPLNPQLVNVIVQLDRSPGYVGAIEGICDDWSGTLRFALSYLMAPASVNAVENLGEVNMGKAEALVDFVSWAMDNYPAQYYALIIWDHGDGWRKDRKKLHQAWRVAGYDETNNDYLYMDEIQTALRILKERNYKIDLIGFDACLMGMVEVAYELKDYASFMVASEDVIPGEGWRYDLFLKELISLLSEGVSVSPRELGKIIVKSYKETTGSTLSLIDLSRIDDVASLLKELSLKLKSEISLAKLARAEAKTFYDSSIIDLYSFASSMVRLKSSSTELISSLCEAINEAVVENYSLYGDSYGLSIYFPDRGKGAYDRFYDDLRHDFSGFTKWGEFIKAYLKETRELKNVGYGTFKIDGSIGDDEIKDALELPFSDNSSFKAYFKNSEDALYIALKVYSDASLDIGDAVIIYIDSDGDGAFPGSRSESEGMLKVFYDGSRWVAYFYPIWYDYSKYKVCFLDPSPCPEIDVKGKVNEGGFLEIEIKIPLGSGRFPFKAGSIIGYYLQVYDGGASSFLGEYPNLLSMGEDEQIPTLYTPPRLEPLMYYALKLNPGGGSDDDDGEFVVSSGCSLGYKGSLSVLVLFSFAWVFILGVKKR